MELDILSEIISEIKNCHIPGYGYVKKVMDVLERNHTQWGIGAACTVWNVDNIMYYYYMNNNRINLKSLNLSAIMEADSIIDSRLCDMSPYKHTIEFGLSHIICIPINCKKTGEVLFEIKGAIILISPNILTISSELLHTFFLLISNSTPETINCNQVSKAINTLVGEKTKIGHLSPKHRHMALDRALEQLASRENSNISKYGMHHFSFWSFDNVGKKYVSKEFNKNTYSIERYKNAKNIVKDDSHYIYRYMLWLNNQDAQKNTEELVWLINFKDAGSSITNMDYFKKVDISADDSVILVFPIRFETYTSVCALYIKNIVYTPFVSKTLISFLADSIRQRITLVNEISIRNMLSRMMSEVSLAANHLGFYQSISKILKITNEAEHCLIYLRNEFYNRYLLVTEENENHFSTDENTNVEQDDICFYMPRNFYSDTDFILWLKSVLKEKNMGGIYENNISKIIKTACMTPVVNKKGDYYGFILLFNKKHEINSEGTYFHQAFFQNNVYITKTCSDFLILYRNLEFSDNKRNTLLKKYRHEMPTCIDVIDTNIREIRRRYQSPLFRIKELPLKADELIVNCERLDMLASFFSAIDFEDERLLQNRHPFILKDFIKSKLQSFQSEAAWRGVTVRTNIGIDTPTQYVSLFYQLSVTNFIINAIRYAAPGTCVLIESDSDKIVISDVGIPIPENEQSKIFLEGFRGQHARDFDQRGMGYGLYFAKRIMDLYEQKISVESKLLANRNYYAEYAIYRGIKEMTKNEGDKFIYNKVIYGDKYRASDLFIRIQSSEKHIPEKKFINNDLVGLMTWLDYKRKYGPPFLVMEKNIFNKPIYKVIFTITF